MRKFVVLIAKEKQLRINGKMITDFLWSFFHTYLLRMHHATHMLNISWKGLRTHKSKLGKAAKMCQDYQIFTTFHYFSSIKNGSIFFEIHLLQCTSPIIFLDIMLVLCLSLFHIPSIVFISCLYPNQEPNMNNSSKIISVKITINKG